MSNVFTWFFIVVLGLFVIVQGVSLVRMIIKRQKEKKAMLRDNSIPVVDDIEELSK